MKIFDFNKLTDTVSSYVETRIELLKLDLKEQSVRFMAKFLTLATVVASAMAALFFLSLGLSSFLNEVLESSFWGYVIVAGIYLLVGIVTFIYKAHIEERMHARINESEILEEEPEKQDEE